MLDYSGSTHLPGDTNPEHVMYYQTAQHAVRQSDWHEKMISSSAAYLRYIFEDDGAYIEIWAGKSITEPFYTRTGNFICSYPNCTSPPFQTQVSNIYGLRMESSSD
jgi:hypothetical protein